MLTVEKAIEEVSKSTLEEIERVTEKLKDVFKGGVTIINPEDMDNAMINYYKDMKISGY